MMIAVFILLVICMIWLVGLVIQLKRTQSALTHKTKALDRILNSGKQAEGGLESQNRRLAHIIEGTDMGTWEWNVQTGETIFNRRWADIIGYTLDELGPVSIETWLNYAHPQDLEKSNAALEKHFKGESEHYTSECRMKHKDGHWVWVFDKGKVISRTEDGKPLWMYGTHQDITERKKAEKRLRRIEDLSNTIQRMGKIGAWEWDLTAEKVYWTKQMYRLHDMVPEYVERDVEFMIEKSAECFRSDDRLTLQKAFLNCMENGIPYQLEFPFLTTKGRRIWIQTSAKRVTGKEGGKRIIGYLMDITERKMNEKVLRREDKKYRTILQTTVNGFWLTDLKGRILEINEAYCRMSGYSEHELLAMNIAQLEGNWGPDEIARKIDEVIASGHDRFETRHRRKNGSFFDVEVSVQYLAIEDGRLVIFLRDISMHKKAEKDKAHLQSQLSQARKMESVGRLAGGVAHDLNNLLSPILGYSEMLLEDLESSFPYAKELDSIYTAGLGARNLVRQLLAFSRKQTLEFRLVDVDKGLTDFGKLLRRTIREDIDLKIIPSAGVKTVMADVGQLEQIIMNLAVNASDAMPDGGVLTIKTELTGLDESYVSKHPGLLPGQYVLISFSDTGHGMDHDTLEKIFDPFFSTKGDQGTGLGLATVYGIVKQHKGNIWVYSEIDMGTVFKVYLPFSAGVRGQSKAERTSTADLNGTETILLVEDNKAVRDLAGAMLTNSGYTVFQAKDGNEALDIWASHGTPVSLLITDVIMPEMNGKELFATLNGLDQNIKVLYMSGYTNNVIAHHGVLDDDVQFVQKPFSRKKFLSKVRSVLDQQSDTNMTRG